MSKNKKTQEEIITSMTIEQHYAATERPTLEELAQKENRKVTIRSNGKRRVQRLFHKPSMTQQHLRHEVDTKSILQRYLKTGQLPVHIGKREPKYGDFTDTNYFESMAKAKAQVSALVETFNNLPENIQAEFGGDPGAYVQWLSDPKNAVQAKKLGLIMSDLPENLANPGKALSSQPPKTDPVKPDSSKQEDKK